MRCPQSLHEAPSVFAEEEFFRPRSLDEVPPVFIAEAVLDAHKRQNTVYLHQVLTLVALVRVDLRVGERVGALVNPQVGYYYRAWGS
jgi:hypothetical protein